MVATSVRPPGVSVIRSAITSLDHRVGQALQQRDALAQRRLELELAAHGALGDGGDVRLQAGVVGQFVDALLADHGGIHVGEEQPLAAGPVRRHDHVDRPSGEAPAQVVGERALAFHAAVGQGKGNVGGDAADRASAPRRRPAAPRARLRRATASSAGEAGFEIRVAT